MNIQDEYIGVECYRMNIQEQSVFYVAIFQIPFTMESKTERKLFMSWIDPKSCIYTQLQSQKAANQISAQSLYHILSEEIRSRKQHITNRWTSSTTKHVRHNIQVSTNMSYLWKYYVQLCILYLKVYMIVIMKGFTTLRRDESLLRVIETPF